MPLIRDVAPPQREPYAFPTMKARARKAIGSVGILAFLALYVWAAVSLAGLLPDHWAIRLGYYLVVGTAWGLPLIPLISWMNRDP